MLLRNGRHELLHALAMLVCARRSVIEELEGLGVGDRALMRCARCLVPRLRVGQALHDALAAERLVSRADRRELAQAGDHGALAEAMARIAVHGSDPTPGYWFIRWYPVWLACAAMLPAAAFALMVKATTSDLFVQVYGELGIAIPASAWMCMDPPGLVVFKASLHIAVVAAAIALIAWVRPLRHALHLWCPEVHLTAAAVRLIQQARWAAGPANPTGRIKRWLWCIGLGIQRPGAPSWDLSWRTWMFLTRFRLRPGDRELAGQMPDLAQRVSALGWLWSGTDDWYTAETEARQRYLRASASARPLLLLFLYGMVFSGWYLFLFSPVFKIIQELGSQTG
ncbi:MAG: hypothetical protein H0V44_14265 [Planctomycetes bacterium]|nr:hypothetical protein [Planctomycetota bacterium]